MPLTHKPHRRRSGVVQQHKSVLPTHSPHTHNDSPTCSCQRGTAAFPKMYTKPHTYREEKKNTRKEEQQQQDTNSRQNTQNTIITGATPIREKQSPTPAHQLNPKKEKKKTDPLREAEADQSQSISPRVAVTQANHTPQG
ncbi:uncharacterized protein TM35_000331600 [Trypanosoma theileri]|uniref:Uncharacterized protein n=1 Tax=Trypanosoma theileri TaxID=67003 RepID=A0A1X0NMI7_9TRYP|nr:uncharacterized protein TM35_000331600 [Trypanosoma theileri]ORC85703.1 hypothetical protein TM35_000331600 [Trypanosoma theileri]